MIYACILDPETGLIIGSNRLATLHILLSVYSVIPVAKKKESGIRAVRRADTVLVQEVDQFFFRKPGRLGRFSDVPSACID